MNSIPQPTTLINGTAYEATANKVAVLCPDEASFRAALDDWRHESKNEYLFVIHSDFHFPDATFKAARRTADGARVQEWVAPDDFVYDLEAELRNVPFSQLAEWRLRPLAKWFFTNPEEAFARGWIRGSDPRFVNYWL